MFGLDLVQIFTTSFHIVSTMRPKNVDRQTSGCFGGFKLRSFVSGKQKQGNEKLPASREGDEKVTNLFWVPISFFTKSTGSGTFSRLWLWHTVWMGFIPRTVIIWLFPSSLHYTCGCEQILRGRTNDQQGLRWTWVWIAWIEHENTWSVYGFQNLSYMVLKFEPSFADHPEIAFQERYFRHSNL